MCWLICLLVLGVMASDFMDGTSRMTHRKLSDYGEVIWQRTR